MIVAQALHQASHSNVSVTSADTDVRPGRHSSARAKRAVDIGRTSPRRRSPSISCATHICVGPRSTSRREHGRNAGTPSAPISNPSFTAWSAIKDNRGPKTENSTRAIPLCDAALEALKMAQIRSGKRTEKSSLVFPGRKGPLNDVRESLYGACARAGIPHVRVHGLRHTFGSQMAMAGADPFAIMKAMGHADFKTTMIYVSLGKSHIRDQVEKLNTIPLLLPPA